MVHINECTQEHGTAPKATRVVGRLEKSLLSEEIKNEGNQQRTNRREKRKKEIRNAHGIEDAKYITRKRHSSKITA